MWFAIPLPSNRKVYDAFVKLTVEVNGLKHTTQEHFQDLDDCASRLETWVGHAIRELKQVIDEGHAKDADYKDDVG